MKLLLLVPDQMDAQHDDKDGKQRPEGEGSEHAEGRVQPSGDRKHSHDHVEKIHQIVPEEDDSEDNEHGGHGFPVFLQPLTAQEREIFLMEEIIVLHGVKFLIRHGV